MNKIKLVLGLMLLIIGIIGLYSTALLPAMPLTSQNDVFQIMLIEVKRNRLITSAFILISGLILIIDSKK